MYLPFWLSVGTVAAAASGANIRRIPDSAWQTLNSSVGGRLGRGRPMAYPCFNNYNGAPKPTDAHQCSMVERNGTDTTFVASRFGGFENGNWGICQKTSIGCEISALNPPTTFPVNGTCSQGNVPDYYISISCPQDVSAGLAFAEKHDIPIVVKNTGHDYKGRSAGANSLALWTHTYQPEITLIRNFIPEGCLKPVGDVVTFGAGQEFHGIYKFADKHNVTVVGGSGATVGASGGWLLGGGHSSLSNTLGLGVDNAQQIKVVLPNGTYITASRCQNTDMFFALRGGGGNAFGVVMETTTTAHPVMPLQVAVFQFKNLNSSQCHEMISICVKNALTWASRGFGGYISPTYAKDQVSYLTALSPAISLAEANRTMKPLFDFAKSLGSKTEAATVSTTPNFYDVFVKVLAPGMNTNQATSQAVSSRIVPSRFYNNTQDQGTLIKEYMKLVTGGVTDSTDPVGGLYVNMNAPYTYKLPETDLLNGPGASSVTPAWRHAPWHTTYTREWDPIDKTAAGIGSIQKAFQNVHDGMNRLRSLTPDGGAYQNEGDTYEPDAAESFWGRQNYNKLLSIKREIDPTNLLTCHQCIGWNSTDSRFGCYPEVIASS